MALNLRDSNFMVATIDSGFESLFDGTYATFKQWRQVGPEGFTFHKGEIVTSGPVEFSLLYYTCATFGDFVLRLEFSLADPSADNSGIFVRFRDPSLPPTREIVARDKHRDIERNRAWIAVFSGFEVQIDEQAVGDKRLNEPDGLEKNRTGAIYKIPTGQNGEPRLQQFVRGKPLKAEVWNQYEIRVSGDTYAVRLNGKQTTKFINTDPKRGLRPQTDPTFGYVGIQSYPGSRVAFRDIKIEPLP